MVEVKSTEEQQRRKCRCGNPSDIPGWALCFECVLRHLGQITDHDWLPGQSDEWRRVNRCFAEIESSRPSHYLAAIGPLGLLRKFHNEAACEAEFAIRALIEERERLREAVEKISSERDEA